MAVHDKSVFLLSPLDLKEFANEIKQELVQELSKKKVIEQPMCRKEVAKFLKCAPETVTRNWNHLRHVVDGQIYWFASEIEAYIKEH